MKITKILASAALVFSSAFAAALPMYEGATTSDTGFNGRNMSSAGYYLWNDASNTNQWYLRWTGINANTSARRVHWEGQLEFRNSNLGSHSEFRFEGRDERLEYTYNDTSADVVEWKTRTNTRGGIDGIDFTLSDGAEILDFSLGSNLFNGLDDGLSSNIYIGDAMNATQMRTTTLNGLTFQNFGIDTNTAAAGVAVAEPGSLLLLGVGLVGLGLSRRRCI
ncbi:MAG: PEP-CTERM sorting domain-containing protein [Cellvibrionaceae bacterium]|nr:PEP-CTERM sorting domain-containing protein [Cellvibrionaceae bacterium]